MKTHQGIMVFLITLIALFQFGMARHGVYDEEAREAERVERAARKSQEKEPHHPAKGFASGVKEATVDSTKEFIDETAEETGERAPVVGTLEGARLGSGKVLDKTVKGAYKVATLGFGDLKHYEVEEPESGKSDTTKIKISL